MGDYSGSADVGAPAGQLFDYLSKITNLPRYFTAMTSAEPAGQDEVHVVADVDRCHPGGGGVVPGRPGTPAPGMGIRGTGQLSRLPRCQR